MFFKSVILALLASSAVLAAPMEEHAPGQLQERQNTPSVLLCVHASYRNCDTIFFQPGGCQGVGRLNNAISSIRANGNSCTFYNDTGCRSGGGQFHNSGDIANIRSHSSFSTMNDDISSFRCQQGH